MESIHLTIIVTNILIGIAIIAIVFFGIRFLSLASKNREKGSRGLGSPKNGDIE